jgi:hypothetical protein
MRAGTRGGNDALCGWRGEDQFMCTKGRNLFECAMRSTTWYAAVVYVYTVEGATMTPGGCCSEAFPRCAVSLQPPTSAPTQHNTIPYRPLTPPTIQPILAQTCIVAIIQTQIWVRPSRWSKDHDVCEMQYRSRQSNTPQHLRIDGYHGLISLVARWQRLDSLFAALRLVCPNGAFRCTLLFVFCPLSRVVMFS